MAKTGEAKGPVAGGHGDGDAGDKAVIREIRGFRKKAIGNVTWSLYFNGIRGPALPRPKGDTPISKGMITTQLSGAVLHLIFML